MKLFHSSMFFFREMNLIIENRSVAFQQLELLRKISQMPPKRSSAQGRLRKGQRVRFQGHKGSAERTEVGRSHLKTHEITPQKTPPYIPYIRRPPPKECAPHRLATCLLSGYPTKILRP